jgi:signal transduction histidine kinase
MLVPAHAEACFVDVPCRAGETERIVAELAEPLLLAAREAYARDSLLGDISSDAVTVRSTAFENGRSCLVQGRDLAERLGGTEPERRMLAALQPRAALVVPLLSRGRALGTLTLLRVAENATFTDEETRDLEDVALQAGLLLENARLERRSASAQRARSEFLAIVSHELRTPLNIILGYTELMLSGIPETLQPGNARQVERVRASARYLLQRIEEVLAFARLEGRREGVRLEPVQLRPLVAGVLELVEPLAAAKGLELRTDDAPDVELVTDSTHLRQVLLHLLTNAVRFTDSGSVDVAVSAAADTVVISVTDTGRGMTAEELSHVFEPFWQADPLETRTAHGTGLGLSLACRLATLLGGEITCSSNPGEGSVFRLHLPRRGPER